MALIITLLTTQTLFAQDLGGGLPPEVELELKYAQALINWGMPDYAERVMKSITDPSARSALKVMKLQSFIALGKWGEVDTEIAKEANQDGQDAWAMKLAKADGYYAWSKYPEAKTIYLSFFNKYPEGPVSAGMNSFYMESAYKFAQMLLLLKDDAAALDAYNKVLKAKLGKQMKRRILCEKAELMVRLAETASNEIIIPPAPTAPVAPPKRPKNSKVGPSKKARAKANKAKAMGQRDKYFAEIDEICNEILWQQDVWFGKAIVLKAHVKMIQDDPDGAMELIEEYKDNLMNIDKVLADAGFSQLSPMAQCRYMIGKIMQEKAEKLNLIDGQRSQVIALLVGKKNAQGRQSPGAFQHMLNVFIRYPSSQWAMDAGKRADNIKDLAEKLGVKISIPDYEKHLENVMGAQFTQAKVLFSQNQFAMATEAYVDVLNLFPESNDSVAALGNLTKCYIEDDNEIYYDMVISYMCERFSKNKDLMLSAGNRVTSLAETFGEKEMIAKKEWTYNQFFTHFTKHPRTASMLYMFGDRKLSEDDYPSALEYYERIRAKHTKSPKWYDAMSKIAYCHSKLGNTTNEINTLVLLTSKLEKKDNPGHALLNAHFRLASTYRKQGGHNNTIRAIKKYGEVIKLMGDTDQKYHNTPEEEEANQQLFEGSLLFKAISYSMIKKPESKIKSYKTKAISTLEQLVSTYPKSKFAPAALAQIGTLWTLLEDAAKAEKALNKLQKEYPESIEAKNALFTLANNLLKLGRRQEAVRIFKQMFESSGKYNATQILMAGNELFKAKEYEIALDAYTRALSMSKKRTTEEPALVGKGKCLIQMKKYDDAAKAIETMMAKYPSSGYTKEANIALSEAYSEQALNEPDKEKRFAIFNKSAEALQKTVRFARDTPGGMAELDVRSAKIKMLKAEAEKNHGGSAEDVLGYQNDAMGSFQGLMMFGADSAATRPYIEEAYVLCLKLMEDTGRWEDALQDATKFMKDFPNSAKANEVRLILNKAKVKAKELPPEPKESDDETKEETTDE